MLLKTRRHQRDDTTRATSPAEGHGPDENLQGLRSEGQRLLDASDQAISKALSRDSEYFLMRSRQQGGQ